MYPTEIEADFAARYPTHDLGAWHRGDLDANGVRVLSSRKLIVLLGGLHPTSNYKTSMRGGYLSEMELVLYEIYNELAKLRASYYAVNGGEESSYEPFSFVDPVLRIERAIAEAMVSDETIDASEQIYGDMGL